jgi:hypothetical protein
MISGPGVQAPALFPQIQGSRPQPPPSDPDFWAPNLLFLEFDHSDPACHLPIAKAGQILHIISRKENVGGKMRPMTPREKF